MPMDEGKGFWSYDTVAIMFVDLENPSTADGAAVAASLNEVIGARKELRRNFDVERVCRLEVDHQLEAGRPQDRKVVRLCTGEHHGGIQADLPILFLEI